MGELHKFKDDVRTETGRVKPVMAQALDDNFKIVRIKVADNLSGLIRIKDNSPTADSLELAVSSGSYLITIANGVISLVAFPTGSGLLSLQDGVLSVVTAPDDATQFLNGALTFTASETCP